MADNEIHYLENQVETRTKSSAKLLMIFSVDHIAKIAGNTDPDILKLYNDILPFHTTFVLVYDGRISAKAARKSATAAIKGLLNDLKKNKVPAWDVYIQTQFPKKSPGYIALLPLGRKTLNTGKMDQRIQELAAFITNCGETQNLRTIKTEAQTALTAINAARDLQQAKEGAIRNFAATIEAARVNLSKYLYRNICSLAAKFFENPKAVEAYFEFGHIRSRKTPKDDEPGNSFSVQIEPASTKEAGFAFAQTAKFYFYNYGEVPVTIYAGDKDAPEPEGAFVLEAGAEAEKPVTELGPAGSRYMYFVNHSDTTKAMMEVVLI
jgi:hypothetical protein